MPWRPTEGDRDPSAVDINDLPEEVYFGGYELLKRLAAGGMAEIFLARADGDKRDELLVVKRLLPHIARHPRLVQMFLDEARIAATLDHPGIVKIFNVGSIGDQYFLSLEYLHGVDVAKVLRATWRKKKQLPLELALYVSSRVCEALAYAHTRSGYDGKPLRIVHRDLSPQNLFITFEGDVKIVDFGVAKAANALHQTKTGALVGKVGYMSPEQCRSDNLDCRSDLFSLGIVLYELVTGRRLYNAKKLGEFEVLRRICDEPVTPPSQIHSECPAAVSDIVMKALEKDPKDRYQSAAEFGADVDRVAKELDLELSRDAMHNYLAAELEKIVETADASLNRLLDPNRPKAIWQPTPSGLVPMDEPISSPGVRDAPAPADSDEGEFDDKTERLVKQDSGRIRRAKWRSLDSLTPREQSVEQTMEQYTETEATPVLTPKLPRWLLPAAAVVILSVIVLVLLFN